MNKFTTLTLFITGFILNQQIYANSKEQLFYDAVRFESTGQISAAISLYEQIAKEASSSNLHGNLANLYFKSEDYGRSILNYRKALNLDNDNRDFHYNLVYVKKVAGLPPMPEFEFGYLGGTTNNFWKVFLAIVFWAGFLLVSIFFYKRYSNNLIYFIFACWTVLNLIIAVFVYHSGKQKQTAELEVIALKPNLIEDTNESINVQLRKFAAENSTSNTEVKPGESLLVLESSRGGINSHNSQDLQKWLLVSSPNNRKKGWVSEREIGWIVDK